MLKKPRFAVIVVTTILIIYCVLINFNGPMEVIYLIFAASPFLIIWMVYTVLRYGAYNGRELKDDEEWGYQDKKSEDMGVF